jgi:DNA-3-methyladenine glycosylase I
LLEFIWRSMYATEVVNNRAARRWYTPQPLNLALGESIEGAGISFSGTTISYAFMQAVGMLNDHKSAYFCYESSTLVAI